MKICPKHVYFVCFSCNFLGTDPTHTVYSLPSSWTQRERSASTHTVQFDQTTRWWAKVCLHLCVAGQEGTFFFLCQRNRTNRNWKLLDDFNQVSLQLLFHCCDVYKFVWTLRLHFHKLYFLVTEIQEWGKLQCNVSFA